MSSNKDQQGLVQIPHLMSGEDVSFFSFMAFKHTHVCNSSSVAVKDKFRRDKGICQTGSETVGDGGGLTWDTAVFCVFCNPTLVKQYPRKADQQEAATVTCRPRPYHRLGGGAPVGFAHLWPEHPIVVKNRGPLSSTNAFSRVSQPVAPQPKKRLFLQPPSEIKSDLLISPSTGCCFKPRFHSPTCNRMPLLKTPEFFAPPSGRLK